MTRALAASVADRPARRRRPRSWRRRPPAAEFLQELPAHRRLRGAGHRPAGHGQRRFRLRRHRHPGRVPRAITDASRCVPKGVDIAAAFLYWQVIGDQNDPEAGARGVKFHGQPLSLAGDVEILFGKKLGLGSPPCWSNGGGTGGGSGARNLTYTYRADVLRFLEIDPETGKTAGYGAHRVQTCRTRAAPRRSAPAWSSSTATRRCPTAPSSSTTARTRWPTARPAWRSSVEGFYDADDVNTQGKITHIVGSGQANKSETVFYNGTTWNSPFTGEEGPNWDNPTFPVTVDPSLRVIQTGALPQSGSSDCLTWAAVVYRTPLNDDDEDGLLNRWETSTDADQDPYGRALPPLSKMGADPNVKDIFMEVNYMKTDVGADVWGRAVPRPYACARPRGDSPVRRHVQGAQHQRAHRSRPDLRRGIGRRALPGARHGARRGPGAWRRGHRRIAHGVRGPRRVAPVGVPVLGLPRHRRLEDRIAPDPRLVPDRAARRLRRRRQHVRARLRRSAHGHLPVRALLPTSSGCRSRRARASTDR